VSHADVISVSYFLCVQHTVITVLLREARLMNIEKLQQLIKEKDILEAEIQALIEFLNRPGNFGTKGRLVDDEGFPIVDYEKAYTVREARGMLQRKQNDHIALMKQIELGLYEVHAAARQRKENHTQAQQTQPLTQAQTTQNNSPAAPSSTTSPLPSTTTFLSSEVHSQTQQLTSDISLSSKSSSSPLTTTTTTAFKSSKAFARVNSVVPSSPAALSGLQVGDLIIHFGTINVDNHNNLLAIRDVVIRNENKEIQVTVRRNADEIHTLRLVPRKWSGQGLLGCHLLPYKE
jgi:hypothetical protein